MERAYTQATSPSGLCTPETIVGFSKGGGIDPDTWAALSALYPQRCERFDRVIALCDWTMSALTSRTRGEPASVAALRRAHRHLLQSVRDYSQKQFEAEDCKSPQRPNDPVPLLEDMRPQVKKRKEGRWANVLVP